MTSFVNPKLSNKCASKQSGSQLQPGVITNNHTIHREKEDTTAEKLQSNGNFNQ